MAGPFTSYVPPGVYVDTYQDQTVATLAAGLRIGAFIGVSQEYLTLSNFEMVRGSSATEDIRIIGQDVSGQFDGTNRVFTTPIVPIVSGAGQGVVTNDPNTIIVTINGNPAQAIAVDGLTGEVTLGTIPQQGSTVLVSYYISRKDTLITNDDLSDQADGTNTVFKVDYDPIVSGNGGGIITTDPTLVTVTVNGVAAQVTAVDGADGLITLATAPAANATVLATYYFNMWQDTFDYLPQNIQVLNVTAVGDTPNRTDYFQGQDYVIDGTHINWGASYSIAAGETAGTVPFDDSFLMGTLVDNKFYMRPASGTVDGNNKVFVLEEFPTDGTGTDTVTDDANTGPVTVGGTAVQPLVMVYVGTTVATALSAGPVLVTSLVGATKTLTLKTAPAIGTNVYATYWYNILHDDTYTLTAGATTDTFTMSSENSGVCTTAAFSLADSIVTSPNFQTEGIQFPNGVEDTQTIPGEVPTGEDVTLTFIDNVNYTVGSSLGAEGSHGSGMLGQTYVDGTTGLRFTVMPPETFTYQPGDLLVLHTTPNFSAPTTKPIRSISGLWLTVQDISSVQAGDQGVVTTFNKSGNDPAVGDSYYVSLTYKKTDFSPQILTQMSDVINNFGPVNVDNRLSLAAQIAFLNGAPAVALLQVLRGPDGVQAVPSSFMEAIDSLENPITQAQVSPNFLVPLTTDQSVIQYAKKHVDKVSTSRYGQERTAVYGYAVGTSPEAAQAFALSLADERVLGIYPDGAIMTLTDPLGRAIDFTVDGSFLAAAYVGLATNAAFDVATPLTRKQLVGFDYLARTLDAVQMNQTATAGITVLTNNNSSLQIRQAMTTDPSSVLTREPTVIYIQDYVQQQTRAVLNPFIGTKFLLNRLTDIEIALTSMFKALIQAEIIVAFQNVSAVQDANDPTMADVIAYYSPVFPLNWIKVNYTIRTSLG